MTTARPKFAASIVAALNTPVGNTVMLSLIVALAGALGLDMGGKPAEPVVTAQCPVCEVCPVVAPGGSILEHSVPVTLPAGEWPAPVATE